MKKLILLSILALAISAIYGQSATTINLDKPNNYGTLYADTADVITLRVDTIKRNNNSNIYVVHSTRFADTISVDTLTSATAYMVFLTDLKASSSVLVGDTIYFVGGGKISNNDVNILKLEEDTIEVVGLTYMDGNAYLDDTLRLKNGAAFSNADADTLDISETVTKIDGKARITGTTEIVGNTTVSGDILTTDASKDIGSSTTRFNLVYGDTAHFNVYTNSDFVLSENGSDVTFNGDTLKMVNGAQISNEQTDTLLLKEATVKIEGDLEIGKTNSILFANDASINNDDADTLEFTEVVTKISGNAKVTGTLEVGDTIKIGELQVNIQVYDGQDITTALNTALASYTNIVLPSGTFYVSGNIIPVLNGTSIRGAGMSNTIIKIANAYNSTISIIPATDKSWFYLSDLTLSGNNTTMNNCGFIIDQLDSVLIERIIVDSCETYSGLAIGTSCNKLSVNDSWFINNLASGLRVNAGTTYGKFENCHFDGNGGYGLWYEAKDCDITNCYVVNNLSDGIYIWSSNQSENRAAKTQITGCHVNHNYGNGINLKNANRTTLSNNNILANYYSGIYMQGCTLNNIVNNYLATNDAGGNSRSNIDMVVSTWECTSNNISNNIFLGGSLPDYNITGDAGSEFNSILNNMYTNGASGNFNVPDSNNIAFNFSGTATKSTSKIFENLELNGQFSITDNFWYNNTDGNLAIGLDAGTNITTTSGLRNLVIGAYAGDALTTGDDNVLIGRTAGRLLTTTSNNTCIGSSSGINLIGTGNTFLGQNSGRASTSAIGNTYIGGSTGYSATTADYNVFIGYSAGYNETGSNLLYIENSNSATPLIYGDFSTDDLIFNGDVKVTDTLSFTNSATITNADADTLELTETAIKLNGNVKATGLLVADSISAPAVYGDTARFLSYVGHSDFVIGNTTSGVTALTFADGTDMTTAAAAIDTTNLSNRIDTIAKWQYDGARVYMNKSAIDIELRRTGLAHGMTALANTDAYGNLTACGSSGGLRIIGLTTSASENGLWLAAATDEATPTDYPFKFSVGSKAATTWSPLSAGRMAYGWYNDTQLLMTLNTSGNMSISSSSTYAAKNYHQLSLYHSAPSICLTDFNINTIITSIATAQDTNAIWLDADDTTPEIGFTNSTGNSATITISAAGSLDITADSVVVDSKFKTQFFYQTQISAALTDDEPTAGELNTATGLTPATAGAGYKVTIKDNNGTGLLYRVESDGTDWFYVVMIKAL